MVGEGRAEMVAEVVVIVVLGEGRAKVAAEGVFMVVVGGCR